MKFKYFIKNNQVPEELKKVDMVLYLTGGP